MFLLHIGVQPLSGEDAVWHFLLDALAFPHAHGREGLVVLDHRVHFFLHGFREAWPLLLADVLGVVLVGLLLNEPGDRVK